MNARLSVHRVDDAEPGGAIGSRYEARLFGPFRVLRDGVPIGGSAGLGRASARTLLKWFLLTPGTSMTRVELARLLWPDLDLEVGQRRVYSTLHYLRRFLEPELSARQPSSFIRSDDGRYRFDPAGRWFSDVASIGQLLAEARSARRGGDTEGAIRALEGVVDCYRQTFLPEDVYDDRFADARASFDVANEDAQSLLLELYLAGGLDDKALGCGLALLERDPYSEVAVTAIAQVYLRQGNPAAASQQLDLFRRHLSRDLGTQPGPQVCRLERHLPRRHGVRSGR
jgi:DNA-binding SARP family transcriptional activator